MAVRYHRRAVLRCFGRRHDFGCLLLLRAEAEKENVGHLRSPIASRDSDVS